MSFSRARIVPKFVYHINAEIIPRSMGPIKDLGILFDSKLKFDSHISNIFIRSNKILGFIQRNCGDFTEKDAFKSIYCSLVRSICEYGSIIWSPYQTSYKLKLEKIQQKFLRFISFKCSIPREPHSSYTPLLAIMNLETLEQRRMRLDIYFTFKIFTGQIDCPILLNRFSFHVPSCSTRNIKTFYINNAITNYASNSPINRIMKTVNNLKIDLFISPNFHSFKTYCNFIFNNSHVF